MRIRRILAGIDFERETEKVLSYAVFMSKAYEAHLHLLHILDYLVTPPAYLLPYIEKEKGIAEEKFALLQKGLDASGRKTGSEVIVGRLRESFDAAMKRSDSDLLVIGFVSHVLRRSSSEKLIKGLKVPMLVVRGEKAEEVRNDSVAFRRILCPTDFSDVSRRALDAAAELAEKFSAQLEVLHVLPEHIIGRMKALPENADIVEQLRANSRDELEVFLESAELKPPSTVREGEPHTGIISFAKERETDLIVMGARGLGHIEGMLIGSVTDAVLKSSPCPVLVIH